MYHHLYIDANIEPEVVEVENGVFLHFYKLGEGKPRIFIISGIHGDEQTGVYISEDLLQRLSKTELFGSVIILPIANPPAFRCKTRISPIDSLDLNRIFPGSSQGTVTERLAAEIWEQARQSDYIIDLHCCEHECVPHVLALHREFSYVRTFSYKLGIPHIIESTGLRGQLFVEASHEGIPAVIIEMRGGKYIDLQSAVQVREALLNFLTALGLVQGRALEGKSEFYGRITEIKSPANGVFIPKLLCGTEVDEETLLGEMKGSRKIHSPLNGLLVYIERTTYVFKGEKVAGVAAKLKY